MNCKRLFIFVEGNDDERFFDRIVKPKFEKKYNEVRLWKYAQVKNTKIDNFLKSIKAMGAEYIFVTDNNKAPCVTFRKQEIQEKFCKKIGIDKNKIIVVIKEIESWYLAGLDSKQCKRLKISYLKNTKDVTKENFNDLIPQKFSKIDFMLEVLKLFSIEEAKQKNISFRYFFEKYNL
jgi:hypothetical protein